MIDHYQDRILETINGEFGTNISRDHATRPLVDAPDLNYDSLRVMELVSVLEERFSVEIDFAADDIQQSFRSVASIARLLERKVQDRDVLGSL